MKNKENTGLNVDPTSPNIEYSDLTSKMEYFSEIYYDVEHQILLNI